MTLRPAAAAVERRAVLLRWHREYSCLIALAMLLLYLAATRPAFFQPGNLRDILVNNSFTLVAGVGATIVILGAGIDISIGSMLAACSVVAALLAQRGLPVPVVVAATLLAGGLLGTVNGLLVAGLDLPPIIVTLGTLSVYRGAVIWYTQGNWIQGLPESFQFLGQGAILGIPCPVWVAALSLLTAAALLQWSRFGRYVRAIGSNPSAALLAGVSVRRVRLFTYVLSGISIGVAALLYASRFSQIQPTAGYGMELAVITAVVVGGTNIFGAVGSVWGTACGILLLGAVDPALAYRHISSYWEGAFQGCFILLGIAGDAVRRKPP